MRDLVSDVNYGYWSLTPPLPI